MATEQMKKIALKSMTASVQEEHQAKRKANNIMEIETLPDNNHSEGRHTLNHAIKDADDIATIYCKIGGLEIPCAMIDTGSDFFIFSDNIAELVEELLDIPITIGSGENTVTITDEFSVVPAEQDQNGNAKSLVIFGTQWQYRAGWELLVKGEFKASRNGKTITIPLSVYKSQRNIFTVGKEPEPVKKN
ncbi:hypothetical protein GLOIN_2v1772633 [Rhizophagus clarus]|uniref:Uncharacterized protein n=1 Tax=Rhizophagus clarus TaxID=94130 RepID=A0A8H3MCB6_9GLOM|nr:hypothetical protein GLOIN_2v1772633 [Rhizophagus clarus]